MGTARCLLSPPPGSRACPSKASAGNRDCATRKGPSRLSRTIRGLPLWKLSRPRELPTTALGAALVRIVRAILRDEQAVLTVSSLVPQSLGLGEVFFSLPAIINRNGVARVLSIPLSQSERKALEASAHALKQYIAALDTSKFTHRVKLHFRT